MPTKCGECDKGFREKGIVVGETRMVGKRSFTPMKWSQERCPVCGGTGWKKDSLWSKLGGTEE
jgi:hypothetical protein